MEPELIENLSLLKIVQVNQSLPLRVLASLSDSQQFAVNGGGHARELD